MADKKFRHSHSPADAGTTSPAHESERNENLHRELHHIVTAMRHHHAVDRYAFLHDRISDIVSDLHTHLDVHHAAHVAGLCIAESWHVLNGHEVSLADKVHAIEAALVQHVKTAEGTELGHTASTEGQSGEHRAA